MRIINKEKTIVYIATILIIGIFVGIFIYSLTGFIKERATEGVLDNNVGNNDKTISNSNLLNQINEGKQQLTSLTQKFQSPISTGTTGNGDVSIVLTPKGVIENNLVVDIAVNTHSVDLSQFNLKEIITLKYNGKKTKPILAPLLQGHHVSDQIVFQIDENIEINSLEIKIVGVPEENERIFKW